MAAADPDHHPHPRRPATTELRYAAELVGLSALAVAQPLFDVFGKAPDAFLYRQADARDIYLFALIITLGPPLVLFALTAPFALLGPVARRRAHLVACGVLVFAFVLLLAREVLSWGTVGVVVLGALGAAAFVVAYERWPSARAGVGFLALAAPVFAALFLMSSPTSALLDEGSGGGDAAPAVDGGGGRPHVVMVVLDELPLASLLDDDGSIDAGLYPNLAAFAGDATWYRNTTTVAGATWHAVPSLLTGRMPVKFDTPTNADHPDNVFTELAPYYSIEASEILTRLCPPSVCDPSDVAGVPTGIGALLDDSRAIYRDLLVPPAGGSDPVDSFREATVSAPAPGPDGSGSVEPGFGDFESSQPARYADFIDHLGGITPSSPPTFSYLHLLLPHEPWRTYPSGATYDAPDEDPGRNIYDWADAPPPVEVARQRHALQLAYADGLVGGIVDQLRATGVYDDAVVVVTSDHGVAFTPGEPVRGTQVDARLDEILPELMWVPLLIKAPGMPAGQVSDENVWLVDVVPTLADLVDVDLTLDVDGISLVSDPARTSSDKAFAPVEISQFGNILGRQRTVDGDVGLAATLDGAIARLAPDRRGRALRLYRIGPYGSLVGESLDGLTLGDPVDDRLVLDYGGSLDAPDGADTVPGLVVGRLESEGVGVAVAVAVNGRVAAVGETFDSQGRPGQLTALVPEELVRADGNEVAYFVVEETEGEVRLRPLDAGG